MQLSHQTGGFAVRMFPDVSNEHWGSFVTLQPQEELESVVFVKDMTYIVVSFPQRYVKGFLGEVVNC